METRLLIMPALLSAAFVLAGCTGVGDFAPVPGPEHLEITMWVEQMDWEIHPGFTTTVWAFCAEGDGVEPVGDDACGVPGPTIRATKGDTITLHFRNDHHIPHTVHFHGWHGWEADMTGNRLLGDHMVTDPGETETITWTAEPSGSFIYHCHFDTPSHMEMGMYGAFIVEDPDKPKPDVEHVAILDEWQIRDQPEYNGNMPAYNFFTISGKSFPTTQPIVADKGDSVRIHMINAGYEFHAMHVHGYTPLSYEGVAGPEAGVLSDVREIAPGQAVVLDFSADREGIWLFHDHVVPRVTAASDGNGFGVYPRGMLTVLVVGDQYLEALQDAVPALLEAAAGDGSGHSDGHDHDDAAGGDADDAGDGSDGADGDGSDGTDGGTATMPEVVPMENFAFSKESITIPAGTRVVWPNRDGVVHTVTFVDGSVDSGNVAAGDSFAHTFDEPGTYDYYCKPHAFRNDDGEWQGMVAQVIVEAA